jgi:pantoate--beta-alanine ligase
LNPEQRQAAVFLSQTLRRMALAAKAPDADIEQIEADALQAMRDKGWQPDYFTIRTQSGLQAIASKKPLEQLLNEPLVALGAAKLGSTRLIDNLEF